MMKALKWVGGFNDSNNRDIEERVLRVKSSEIAEQDFGIFSEIFTFSHLFSSIFLGDLFVLLLGFLILRLFLDLSYLSSNMTDWRQLFAAPVNNSLEFFPPQIVDGHILVAPPSEVFDEGLKDWQFSLVAQFLGKAPNLSHLSRVLSQIWDKKGFVAVHVYHLNLFILQFTSNAARDWILENGPWHINHIPMILRKWEPDLDRLQFDFDRLPLWVHLSNVPLQLFHKTGLSYIASAIGTPLYMDSITAKKKRLAYARVCIEVKAGAVIPDRVPTRLPGGATVPVSVSVPWLPPCCSACKIFGHDDNNCPKKNPKQVWQVKSSSDSQQDVASQEALVVSTKLETDKEAPISSSHIASTSQEIVSELGNASSAVNVESNVSMPITPITALAHVKAATQLTLSPSCDDGFVVVTRRGSSSISQDSRLTNSQKAIVGSANKFITLCDNDDKENADVSCDSRNSEVWNQLIDGAKVRKPRAASKGVANVLQQIKSKKAKTLAKVAK